MSAEEETTVSLSSGSFEDIEKRRKLVIEMLFQGTPTTVMADLCGVDRRTIEADIEYVKKQSAKRIREMVTNRGAVDEMLGDLLTSLDYIRQNHGHWGSSEGRPRRQHSSRAPGHVCGALW